MELNKILKEQNITAQRLSKLTGIGISTIQKYSCKNRKISVDNAKKIAKVLNIEWWELFE
ncbi:hypothetical protein B5E58_11075 [Tyzzerella sp. An114]|uniref:helix-turn-helix domain-containing protein n=1 Tax=Tyzzerella sp. An114 TaxID=1965545 RepID=UPI000B44C3DD|nr:helix-turn-helix transcriptional regulator [Tyzzerella sp. An114]OUQ56209.1 hypothetical protein B5E58_11075 [Tyzzerella sp. An114]